MVPAQPTVVTVSVWSNYTTCLKACGSACTQMLANQGVTQGACFFAFVYPAATQRVDQVCSFVISAGGEVADDTKQWQQ